MSGRHRNSAQAQREGNHSGPTTVLLNTPTPTILCTNNTPHGPIRPSLRPGLVARRHGGHIIRTSRPSHCLPQMARRRKKFLQDTEHRQTNFFFCFEKWAQGCPRTYVRYPKNRHPFLPTRNGELREKYVIPKQALLLKMTALWDVAPCSVVKADGRFRGAYCLHQQGDDKGCTHL
jgi:hypothetical protein